MIWNAYGMPLTTIASAHRGWYGRCGSCGSAVCNHRAGCPIANAATISAHRIDCRCPTCRPDIHLSCANTLTCHGAAVAAPFSTEVVGR